MADEEARPPHSERGMVEHLRRLLDPITATTSVRTSDNVATLTLETTEGTRFIISVTRTN